MSIMAVFGIIILILSAGAIDRLRGDKKHLVCRLFEKTTYGMIIGFLATGTLGGTFAVTLAWIVGCSISWSCMGTYLQDSRLTWDGLEWWQGNTKYLSKYNNLSAFFMLSPVMYSLVVRGLIWSLCLLPLYFCPLVGTAAIGLAITAFVSFVLSLKLVRDYFSETFAKLLWHLNVGFNQKEEFNISSAKHKWQLTEIVRGIMNGIGATIVKII